MLELFGKRGYKTVGFGSPADVYLVNTCTVTSLSDKKSRQMLRRARRLNPEAIVVAAGCYTQVSPDAVLALSEVDLAVGTTNRLKIVDMVESYDRGSGLRAEVGDVLAEREFEPLSVSRQESRTRAFLKIQEGCDQYCSYCIVPYARGHIRSRPEAEVLAEALRLAQNGYKEIVLSGIHVASYGKDLGNTDLLTVISKVHETEGIRRIRLSSIENGIISPDFARKLAKLPKVCPHFHLSLQSGCDRTLLRMNRKYTTARYREAAELLRDAIPGAALTTDIIVGFPGETDEDFDSSLEFVKSMGFAKLHVFPFSPKARTPAAGFSDQVPAAVKNARAARMLALGEELQKEFLERHIGQELEVLYESEPLPGVFEGYSANYIAVRTYSDESLVNEIRRGRVEEAEDGKLRVAIKGVIP
jgi:threonylcarbamoyladenosine tRNA methylthiotransferase MtaB